jgi:predicted Zn-dependent peptidase
MTSLETQLMQRLKVLPPERIAEVVDFVEFLASRVQRAAAAQRLGNAMDQLDALNQPAISEEEVEEEVQAARRERQAARPITP